MKAVISLIYRQRMGMRPLLRFLIPLLAVVHLALVIGGGIAFAAWITGDVLEPMLCWSLMCYTAGACMDWFLKTVK